MRKKAIYTPRYKLMVRLLRDARVNANVTQAEVARRLGRNESQISRWETCALLLDLRDLDEYLGAIGADLVEFAAEWKRLADDLGNGDVEVKLSGQKRAHPGA